MNTLNAKNTQREFSTYKAPCLILFLLFLFQWSFSQTNETASSTDLHTKANILIDEGNELLKSNGDVVLAKTKFLEARNVGKQLQNKRIIYESYLGEGSIGYFNGNYESSFQLLDSILPLIPLSENDLIATCHKVIGNDLVYMGQYALAYDHQLKALEYFKEKNDRINLAKLHFSIGNNFFYQGQYEFALKEFKNAALIWERLKDKKGNFWALGAIASVHEHMQNIDLAIEYSERALDMAYELESPADVAWTLYNVGSIATTAGDLKKGIDRLEEAKNIALQLDDKPLLGYTLEGLTTVHLHLKDFKQALNYLDQSYEIARGNNDLANIPGLYRLYSEIYYQKNDLNTYKIYIDKFIELNDSLKNEELAQSMGSLKQDFEVRELQKTKEIALLKKDSKISNFKKLIWIGSISFAAVVLFLLYIFVRINNKHVKERNQLLTSTNNKILQQNEILKSSNKDLKQYAFIISHDLKEPLRNISSFTTLLERSLGPNINKNSKEYMSFITSGVQQMHGLLTDLMNYSKIKGRNISGKKINCNLLTAEVIDNLKVKFEHKNIQINTAELPMVAMDKDHFQRVIYNLLSNGIKFNEHKLAKIAISSSTQNGFHTFSIKDNGIGIDPSYQEKIFVVFQRLNNRQDYSGSGIGLATCKKIISDYGGKIWFKSTPRKGSSFYFSIPASPNATSNTLSEARETELVC